MPREPVTTSAVGLALADLLADGRARTVPELGRALHVRDVILRDALRSDPRFERSPAPPGRSPQARPWTLATELVPTRPDSSHGLNSRERPPEPSPPFATSEGPWRLTIPAAAPRSVGEAVAAAERRAG